MGTKALRLAVSFLLVLSVIASTGAVLAENGSPGSGWLSKHDGELLAEARAQGDSTVTLLIASQPGANRKVVSGIQGLGGTVRYRDDDVSYIRAIVPIDHVEAAARLNGVQSVDLNEVIPLEDPRPDPDGVVGVIPQPPPGPGTPNNNPYMPIGDTGASQFMAANPTWDGRGVTIGILDLGVSLDHPSLLTTSTGERKIVDWVTFTDPLQGGGSGDPTWVNMQNQVSGGTFTFNGVTYTAPAAGSYRIGLFVEGDSRLGGEVGRNVNRDSDTADVFAVLWDTDSNTVWVDTNQNNNFADDMPMTDYKVNYDVNYFGVDNPATAVAERMPFVVQTDGRQKFVNIGIVS
ncbi:MAG TPA: hypothetical protein VI793_18990, partial [Anaerolineales bacterium]|nr:hypothetical protein [Anaerolineales bacterium]